MLFQVLVLLMVRFRRWNMISFSMISMFLSRSASSLLACFMRCLSIISQAPTMRAVMGTVTAKYIQSWTETTGLASEKGISINRQEYDQVGPRKGVEESAYPLES